MKPPPTVLKYSDVVGVGISSHLLEALKGAAKVIRSATAYGCIVIF
jgi:hypothetical protein